MLGEMQCNYVNGARLDDCGPSKWTLFLFVIIIIYHIYTIQLGLRTLLLLCLWKATSLKIDNIFVQKFSYWIHIQLSVSRIYLKIAKKLNGIFNFFNNIASKPIVDQQLHTIYIMMQPLHSWVVRSSALVGFKQRKTFHSYPAAHKLSHQSVPKFSP